MNKGTITREAGSSRPGWAIVAALVAIAFGVLTIISGGRALFGDAAARAAVGNAVPFVLWFNFVAGFLYILAGAGLYLWRKWAAQLAAVIALATLGVFVAFGWQVATGGAYEMRTVGAMLLRSGVWAIIAFLSCRALGCRSAG
jgi:hypothetical protein